MLSRLFRWLVSLLFVEVQHGCLLPRFYGVAWLLVYRNAAIAMPIPLNLIAGPIRAAWLWAKSGAWRIWHRDQGRVCPHCGHKAK